MTTTLSLAGSYNGLNFGPGAEVHVGSLSGVDDLPPVRSSDTPRGQEHGDFSSVDFLGPRTITMALEIFDSTPAAYRALVDSVIAATIVQPAELPLYFYGSTRLVNCRPRRRSIPYDAEYLRRAGEAVIEFVATDPRIYDANLTSLSAIVAVLGGGIVFPLVFPVTFGATSASGTFTATNAGSYSTLPTAHITGPVDNPRIEHQDQGKNITMAISLAATDYLDIDFAAHSIVLNSTASRRSTLTADSSWFELTPGDNHLRYSANTVQVGSVCTLTFRSAWL